MNETSNGDLQSAILTALSAKDRQRWGKTRRCAYLDATPAHWLAVTGPEKYLGYLRVLVDRDEPGSKNTRILILTGVCVSRLARFKSQVLTWWR